jgi:DNA-binding SARP family transcriptional activator
MRFQVLGPLEVVVDGKAVRLNGIKQRATLGFLLLHANRVVATSQLLRALWVGEAPATARKMLQNAVSGLRRALSSDEVAPGVVMLSTHAPGYVLQVEPECVDLVCFQRMVESGRAELAGGSWEDASRVLREALALWRGPVLTDLVESGISWPELAAVENARLAAFEDCVEAELAYGRHHDVVGELEALVETVPPRERLCGHLMLALYRCGRQADALGAYRRTRARLVEGLGLEPGRELQDLERAILNHDPVLECSVAWQREGRAADTPGSQRALEVARPDPRGANGIPGPAEGNSVPAGAPPETSGKSQRDGPVEPRHSGPPAHIPTSLQDRENVERRLVSVILMLAHLGQPAGDDDPEAVDEACRDVATIVSEEVERLGGVLGATVGPVWSMVFGATRTHEDDAVRAVRAALAVCDRLAVRGFQLAVATGDALVRWRPGETDTVPAVTGGVFERCMDLLLLVPPGEVRVCDATRRASDRAITYERSREASGAWHVTALEPRTPGRYAAVPFVDRDRELEMLRGLLEQVRRRKRPHLVTVLGEPGIGKSRLVAELGRALECSPDTARCVIARTPLYGGGTAAAVLAEIVGGYSGGQRDAGEPVGTRRIAERSDGSNDLAGVRIGRARFNALPEADAVDSVEASLGGGDGDGPFAAWRRALAEIAAERPLVLVIEDLHRADDTLLDFVEDVTERAGPVPLFMIVTARTELLAHRPDWGGGKHRATTMTLDPLSDAAITRLLVALCAYHGSWGLALDEEGNQRPDAAGGVGGSFLGPWFARIGGNPLFAQEYARMLSSGAGIGTNAPPQLASRSLSFAPPSPLAPPASSPVMADCADCDPGSPGVADSPRPLPYLVRSIIASRLDTLPPGAKAVLHDAAVLGEEIWAGAVAAVGGWSRSDAVGWLEYLEVREFLQRARRSSLVGETQYSFRHVLVRDVTYSQIPRSARADKHRLALAWVEGLRGDHTELLDRYRAAAVAAASAGKSSAGSQPVPPFHDGLDQVPGTAEGGA